MVGMEFTVMRDKLIAHFNEMVKDVKHLYEIELNKEELWNLYLDSFPAGTNEIFRERRDHDCNCCKQFIRNIGNAVVIKNNKVETIWDFRTDDTTYQPVLDALAAYVKARAVTNVYIAKQKRFGTMENFEENVDGKTIKWSHFYLDVPDKFIDRSMRSVGDLQGEYRDTKNVFKRSLEEIDKDAVTTVLELIAQNSLYKGKEWEGVLQEFLKYKEMYEATPVEERDNFAWLKSAEAGPVVGRIKNHSIGVLLVNISEGMELDAAVREFERITAPTNYKRSTPVYTKKMLDDAKKTLTEEGYMDSLPRRFAKVDDININDILFCNRDSAKRMVGGMDVFAEMEKETSKNAKKFSNIEEITIDKFISDVLPTAEMVELYLENKHAGNFVSLIAPEIADSKHMFKWDNNFSWAYSGNITDSMKERVKAAGGKVDGDLRFSIQWNDGADHDRNDEDAHCKEPDGHEIYYASKISFLTKGELDVDITSPIAGVPAVENITWASRRTMLPGKYLFYVHCFAARGGQSGFRAEIEFDGQIYSFDCSRALRNGEDVKVAEVTLDEEGNFTIKPLMQASTASRDIWNLKTNDFVPVSVICYSPNYWNEQRGIGHQHVFFMLKDCINPEQPNGFFNEYLNEELYSKHRKVMEAMGSKLAVVDSDDQLSGVGFSMTKRAEVVVKVTGATERILKVKF